MHINEKSYSTTSPVSTEMDDRLAEPATRANSLAVCLSVG